MLMFRLAATGGALFAATLCFLTIIAQIAPFQSPALEMIASFLPQILIFSVLANAIAFFGPRRLALVATVLLVIAALPFVFFSKFERPTGTTCDVGECLTVITINLWGESEFMPALSRLAEREQADLIGINEAASLITEAVYLRHFPDYEQAIHAAWENMPKHMGNPISLLARKPVASSDRILRDDTARRAYIWADLVAPWQETRIVIAHAMTPTSSAGLQTRNTLLEAASDAALQSKSFILMGDFNLTPWTPTFRGLPGKRAGDPRFTRTWPTTNALFGLPIDHIMFSDNLELVEFRVLESIGSDHYPILARFKRRSSE
ncbi:MAG: endonuclease/exonuclease/phosphatase family protein [Pseudomonadota bacterium]